MRIFLDHCLVLYFYYINSLNRFLIEVAVGALRIGLLGMEVDVALNSSM